MDEQDEEVKPLRLKSRIYNNRLIELREQLGLGAREAAERIGITYCMLLEYERLVRNPISNQRGAQGLWRESALLIAKFYGADPEWLFPEVLDYIKKTRAESKIGEAQIYNYLAERDMAGDPPLLPDAEVGNVQASDRVAQALKTLTPREEDIIRRRFFEDKTPTQVAEELDCHRERVRQIEAKALRKLRHSSRSRHLRSFLDETPAPQGGNFAQRLELQELGKQAEEIATQYNQARRKAETEGELQELAKQYWKEMKRIARERDWLLQIIRRVEGQRP